MTRAPAPKIVAGIVLGLLIVWGAGSAYRAYLDRWQGDLRAPLIAGSIAGIVFIIAGGLIIRRADRPGGGARTRDGLGR